MHPNKRASTFRELVAGTVAFNAVSRSSLYLAEHPNDPERGVVCRGKGNLSRTPPAIEFMIAEHRFTANGLDFNVPRAVDFDEFDLTVDDLLSKRQSGTVFALRFTAGGARQYVALGTAAEGRSRKRAEDELRHVMADVERGIWQPQTPVAAEAPQEMPTFQALLAVWG